MGVRIYDINRDAEREVTDADVAQWQRMERAFASLRLYLNTSLERRDWQASEVSQQMVRGEVDGAEGASAIVRLRAAAP